MEADRFEHNRKNYVVGIISLLLSLSLFSITAYIMPNLLFNWRYRIPDFILELRYFILTHWDLTLNQASWYIFLGFFALSCFFTILAYFLSNKIDKEVFGLDKQEAFEKAQPKPPRKKKSAFSVILRVVIIVILVAIASQIFQWAISTTPKPIPA